VLDRVDLEALTGDCRNRWEFSQADGAGISRPTAEQMTRRLANPGNRGEAASGRV